ncbi:hypothetical protein GH714_033416 [Hevea brasiliensis]|uniref:Cupin type-1 domain-containing protein n=1 Tax=Hevea brasiliensis TaxID=3981 RepID=A0A6A6L2R9_HEVBR|nr:hypothetical protein GH714_033416 [Hevea brasiliensis]
MTPIYKYTCFPCKIFKPQLSLSNLPKFEAKDIQPSLLNYNMKGAHVLAAFVLLALSSSFASAFDPSPLQDFCVAINDPKDGVFVNGKFCRDPMLATANDFSFSGLNIPGNTSNKVGSNVTLVNVDKIPGLNTLEILVVLEGTLYVGFVTSNPNRLITKVLNAGDVFVFPIGLIHFQFNIGQTNAVASGLSSQNPGVITIANAVFGSNPPINPDVLTKAFQVDKNVVNYLQKQISKLLLSSSNIPKFEAKDIHPSLINYNMQRARSLVAFVLLALSSSFASAFDPSPLQDFCVAIKDPKDGGTQCLQQQMISFSGLNIPGNTSNKVGSNVTLVNVDKIPGLNTLGISLARIDFAPYGGLNPPHTHPRATEILVVLEGTLYVGFVTSNPNRLITKVLNAGDVFVFPIGLIHFQFNIGQTNAVAISGLSSQNPGVITIANAVFGSNPPINPDVLTKAFQVDKNVVNYLQKQFWVNSH